MKNQNKIRLFCLTLLLLGSNINDIKCQQDIFNNVILEKNSSEEGLYIVLDSAKQLEFDDPAHAEKFTKKVIQLSQKHKYLLIEADAYTYMGLLNEDMADFEKATQYFNMALKIFESENNKKGIASIYNNLGSMFDYKGVFDSSIYYFNKAMVINKETGNELGYGDNLYNTGLIYYATGKNDQALSNWFNALKIFEKLKDYEGMGACEHSIGLVMRAQKEFDKSIEYLEKAYINAVKSKDNRLTADVLMSMGNVYVETKDYNNALKKFKAAEILYQNSGDLFGLASIHTNIGDIFKIEENLDSAIFYYEKSNRVFVENEILSGVTHTYAELAECYLMKKAYTKAIDYCNLSMKVAEALDSKDYMSKVYFLLYRIHVKLNNPQKALDYHVKYTEINDTLFNENKQKIVEELQTKYETEKKEQQIKLQKSDIEKKEALIAKERFLKYGFGAIGLLFILLTLVIYRSNRHKKKVNMLLSQKNEQIMQKNEEITSQRDEIAAQRDLATNQRDIIAHQQRDITDSIKYAFQIQSAIFPHEEEVRLILKDYFILYKPRDIVSGDFYWVNKFGNKIIVVAADCTGHGVPGAFMSMLGVAFLNDIVNKEHITSPSVILNRLREDIILAMKQRGENVKQQDGMDVAAIVIDKEEQTIEFSGANNPLYLIKNEELIETKGDKMPVSIYAKMTPFNSHKFSIGSGDLVYIFSDGYADQFGGPHGKKLKYKYFKELLLNNKTKPMSEQKDILSQNFDSWRGEYPQVDDVLVIGIKI
ncbi:MAG: hypothetical protein CVU05_09190 [Bacteroidetes bacterium HGW-Bacteroidetes-21]|jgi:serine phosphatase RsbU (regulator of sigma subunit)|nr:MAG: hypothetical protein CVU05_09190 [Bacteroidetes bacterium HGW-Bacteroidetes-21]